MRVGCSLIEGRGKQPRFVLGHRTTGDNGAELLGKEMRRTEDSNTDREIPRNLPLRYRGWQPNGKRGQRVYILFLSRAQTGLFELHAISTGFSKVLTIHPRGMEKFMGGYRNSENNCSNSAEAESKGEFPRALHR